MLTTSIRSFVSFCLSVAITILYCMPFLFKTSTWLFVPSWRLNFSGKSKYRQNANARTKCFIWPPSKLRLDISTCKTSVKSSFVSDNCVWPRHFLSRFDLDWWMPQRRPLCSAASRSSASPGGHGASEEAQAFTVHLYLSRGREKWIYGARIWSQCPLKWSHIPQQHLLVGAKRHMAFQEQNGRGGHCISVRAKQRLLSFQVGHLAEDVAINKRCLKAEGIKWPLYLMECFRKERPRYFIWISRTEKKQRSNWKSMCGLRKDGMFWCVKCS